MKDLTSYLSDVTVAPSAEALWDLHCRKMAEYGFDRIIYGFSHFTSETSLGDPDDFVLLTNHEREYMDWFIGQGLYRDAPMVRWALNNVGACSWSYLWNEIARGGLSDREKNVIKVNAKHGVTAGYSISFNAVTSRSKGAVALTAKRGMTQEDADLIWAEHGRDIVLMNNVAHLKILTLPYTTVGRALTDRQREALEWVGDGKTSQDIAILMGLTPSTVDKHLRLARQALAVETTAQAVLKAAFHNQMFIVDAV